MRRDQFREWLKGERELGSITCACSEHEMYQAWSAAYRPLREYQEALMDMVNQHCRVESDPYCDVMSDMALSANEDTFWLLERDGLITRLPGKIERWRLNWDAVTKETE